MREGRLSISQHPMHCTSGEEDVTACLQGLNGAPLLGESWLMGHPEGHGFAVGVVDGDRLPAAAAGA